jgi:hypothetical protein
MSNTIVLKFINWPDLKIRSIAKVISTIDEWYDAERGAVCDRCD